MGLLPDAQSHAPDPGARDGRRAHSGVVSDTPALTGTNAERLGGIQLLDGRH